MNIERRKYLRDQGVKQTTWVLTTDWGNRVYYRAASLPSSFDLQGCFICSTKFWSYQEDIYYVGTFEDKDTFICSQEGCLLLAAIQ